MSLTIQVPYVQDNYFFKLNKYAPVVAIIEGNSTRALTIVTILLVSQLESLYWQCLFQLKICGILCERSGQQTQHLAAGMSFNFSSGIAITYSSFHPIKTTFRVYTC